MCPCIIIICVTTAQVKEFNIPSTQCCHYKFLTKYDNSQRKPSIHPSIFYHRWSLSLLSQRKGGAHAGQFVRSQAWRLQKNIQTHTLLFTPTGNLESNWNPIYPTCISLDCGRNRENMQTAHKKAQSDLNLWPSCCEATVQAASPQCSPPSTNHLVLNKTVKGVTVIFHSLALHYETCKAKKLSLRHNGRSVSVPVSVPKKSNIEKTSSCTKVQLSRGSVV